jgi:hypothetical protein
MEYLPGQLIRVRGVNSRRLAALALAALSIAFGISRTGTTTITTTHSEPKPMFGPKLPTQHVGHPGAGGGGGGTILIGN